MTQCMYHIRLRCVRYENIGILAETAGDAAAIAVAGRQAKFDTVEAIEADDIAITGRCAACRNFIFADDACMKDTEGAMFCAGCVQEELDAVEPPIETLTLTGK